ncbi:MAG: Zn-ribbon containing protein [Candidatus Woesearchaeota archaeon]
MPHQCVKCGHLFDDGSNELLKGCSACGGKFFFFVKDKDINKAKEFTYNLTDDEKKQIEEDVLDIAGIKEEEHPVILDFEAIRVIKPGKYELDIVDLFKDKPLVYKLDEGKYVIDLASTFKAKHKKI